MAEYIVDGEFGAMQIEPAWVPEGHRKGALAYGNKATVFGSYASAGRAIQRTKEYAEEHNLEKTWKLWKMGIKRLDRESAFAG